MAFNDKSAVRTFLLCMIRINVPYDILDIIKKMYKNIVLLSFIFSTLYRVEKNEYSKSIVTNDSKAIVSVLYWREKAI